MDMVRETVSDAFGDYEQLRPKFYVLVCRECGDGENALPMPFSSPAERGHWAAEHKRGTGHDRWFVIDQ